MNKDDTEVKTKHPGGRPRKYKPEYNEMAYKLCLLGYTDIRLAEFFCIAESTLHKWKHDFPKFSEFIAKGKELADIDVVLGLYKRATGMTVKKTQFATFQGEITDQREYEEELPPDVNAARLWLSSRQPEIWKDRQSVELTGKNGGPVEIEEMTSDERKQRIKELQDKLNGTE